LFKIGQLAKELNITKMTLWNWKKEGKIEFIKNEENGYNYVSEETYNKFLNINQNKTLKEKIVYIYTRVSSPERKNNLDTQAERLLNYANINGMKVNKIYKEIGSGFNDNRKILNQIIEELKFDILIIEHKDRLTRIGFHYLENLLKKLNKEIIVVNNVDIEEKDIIQDFISIITSYTSRIYGNRRKNRKSLELIKELKNETK
jgi:putative resolvase